MNTGRLIQELILFSTALGVFFLWEAYPLLQSAIDVFYFLSFGWFLFLVDSVLTFYRPGPSYYLGLVLAAVALGATFSSPEHYSLIESGNVTATVILVLGSVAQALIIGFVLVYSVSQRRKDPWAWPGEETHSD